MSELTYGKLIVILVIAIAFVLASTTLFAYLTIQEQTEQTTDLNTEGLATSEDITKLENTIYISNRLLGCNLLDSYFQNIEFEGRVEVRTVFVMGCVPNQAEIELMREQQGE